MNRQKGTITVFLSLISVLFLSLVCTLVESARVQGARAKAAAFMDMAMFSTFGEFDTKMLEDYDVFFLDGSYGKGGFQKNAVEGSLERYIKMGEENQGFRMFPLELGTVQVTGYGLATDQNGGVFYCQAVENQKETLVGDVAAKLKEEYEKAKEQKEAGENYEKSDTQTQQQMKELEEQQKQQESERQEQEGETEEPQPETEAPAPPPENPLDQIKRIKEMGILGLVKKDVSSVSQKEIEKAQLPSGRELEKGNLECDADLGGIVDQGLFLEYLFSHFSSGEEEKDGGLSYQLEYILLGNESDVENLKGVVNRLLLMREGTNFLYAMGNETMKAQAQALAAALVGGFAIPGLVTVIKMALLLAWAYGESLLDVRTLLAGGKVPLTKSQSTWKLSQENLGRLTEILESCDHGEGEGLSYRDYLKMLFLVGDKEAYPMRALDMIESSLKKEKGMENFQADACVGAIEAEAEFGIPQVFLRVPAVFLGTEEIDTVYKVSGGIAY